MYSSLHVLKLTMMQTGSSDEILEELVKRRCTNEAWRDCVRGDMVI